MNFKNISALLLISVFSLFAASLKAQTPDPPPGMVWILNAALSDEFDASSPGEKWSVYDKAESWDRTAAFDKRVQEVQLVDENGEENYILAMNPMWYEEEDIFTKNGRTYYFAGGGMATHATTTYGYMEVRIKPSNFPMGSGVFMHSRKASDDPCGEKYGTELDIIENMSYDGPGYSDYWNGKMHVNTHVKPTDENCNGLTSIQHGGSSNPLEGPLDFNVVGAHWKSMDSVDFYLNGKYWHSIEFLRDFDLPMPLILTMETYTWGSDENNAGNPKPEEYMFQDDFRTREERAVYYDWVRTWQLVDIDTSEYNNSTDNVGFYQDPVSLYEDSILDFTLLYSATEQREIVISVYDAEEEILGSDTLLSETGVKSLAATVKTAAKLSEGSDYRAICILKPLGGDESSILASDTVQLFIEIKAVETKLFPDLLPSRVYPSSSGYILDVKYQGAEDMEVAVEVRDPSGAWIGGGLQDVPDGEGVAQIQANLSAATAIGSGYSWKSHIRPRGTTWRESIHALAFVPFSVVKEPQSEISLFSDAWPSMDTVSMVKVSVLYNALEEAKLHLQLFRPDRLPVADTLLNVNAGADSLQVDLILNIKPEAANDYKIIGQLLAMDDDKILVADTLKDLEIIEVEDPVGNQWRESERNALALYPNPASGSISLRVPEFYGNIDLVSVSDISGRILLKTNLKNEIKVGNSLVMNISTLPAGFYFIQVSTANAQLTGSFIVQ